MTTTDADLMLSIPPRPEAVTVLREEMASHDPDLRRVARGIMGDVALSAAMLRTVNSPAFGLRTPAKGVAQAIDYLGLRQAGAIATGLAIRQAMGDSKQPGLDRFWDTAEKVALFCAVLARHLRGIPADEAYTYGLFHDCGIPLLMRRHPAYRETLKRANNAAEPFTAIEEQDVGTHHGAIGSLLAYKWHLPETICQAILRHHDVEVFHRRDVPDGVLGLIAVGHLAEHIHHELMRSSVDLEWAKFEQVVFDYFSLDGEDFLNLVHEAQEALAEG